MKTRLLIIIVISTTVLFSASWNNQSHASCVAEVNYDLEFENSELVFSGTVTRLDNYDGPQQVTFFIHEISKGQVNTPKHILENTGLIFHDNDTVESSSINVDYKIGKTYKVYVQNGQTNLCTTKLTATPSDYMWEPGPEDGNYYSENSEFVNPCPEGYGLSDDVCITLEEMNKDTIPRLEPVPEPEPEPEQDLGMSENCEPGTILEDGICQVIELKKIKTIGSDAPFFGIFVYLDNFISWIFGK